MILEEESEEHHAEIETPDAASEIEWRDANGALHGIETDDEPIERTHAASAEN